MTARRYSTTTRRCASAVSLCGDRQAAPTYSPVLRVAVSRAGVPPTVGTTDGGQARGAESRPASSTASLPLSGHDGAHCAHRELSVTRKSHGRGGSTAGAPCSGRPLDLTLQERERSGVPGTGRLPPPPHPPCPALPAADVATGHSLPGGLAQRRLHRLETPSRGAHALPAVTWARHSSYCPLPCISKHLTLRRAWVWLGLGTWPSRHGIVVHEAHAAPCPREAVSLPVCGNGD